MAEKETVATVICTANVCRSPMAAALLEHALKAEPEPLRSVRVQSAGIAAYDGDAVSENSVRALEKVGIDIKAHRSQRMTQKLLVESDLVVCMTESHREMLKARFPQEAQDTQILLMRELVSPDDPQVADPFGADLNAYMATRDSLVEATPSIIERLRQIVSKKEKP